MKILEKVKFEKYSDGLIPVVVQDIKTNQVVMMAYVSKEALIHTISTGNATYFSRSRKSLWIKGETSGNLQKIHEILLDCDGDALMYRVELLSKTQGGEAACHEGYKSCFFRTLKDDEWTINSTPLFDPKKVYEK